jgi:hypothetical protein
MTASTPSSPSPDSFKAGDPVTFWRNVKNSSVYCGTCIDVDPDGMKVRTQEGTIRLDFSSYFIFHSFPSASASPSPTWRINPKSDIGQQLDHLRARLDEVHASVASLNTQISELRSLIVAQSSNA